jgi:hypothetical protein
VEPDHGRLGWRCSLPSVVVRSPPPPP